jgi:hypothetical protein
MPEIVGTFARAETRDEGANSSTQRWDGPGGNLAQERLEFAEGHLDRVKVGGILRQIAKGCSRGLDRLTHAGDFVGSKIIDHHAVVSLQCWHEAMFNIGKEHFSGHRPIEHHRCHHLVVTKRGDESDRLPGPLRHIINHPLATWSAAVEPHHVGTDGRLVDKDQMGGIKQALVSDPTPPCPSHVRPLPFCCLQAFF